MSEIHHPTRTPSATTNIHRRPLTPAQPTSRLRPRPMPLTSQSDPNGQNGRRRLDLLAFVQLHKDHYLLYARTRLDETVARAAVSTALDTVERQWDNYLRCAQPAADAWRRLSAEVHARSLGTDGSAPAVTRLYRSLPHDAADAVVLRWRMRLDPDAIADLMGLDPASVTVLLLTAQRLLPTTELEQLEEHRPLL
ncbi:hypothetical protein ACFVFH_27400 [Streptomyces sp. NPDC057697]|uniref:hypothetical protein n=1 Tax=Streptomyces sp. NPDC057697 TaxID=3346219 RepID=UPI0036A6F881